MVMNISSRQNNTYKPAARPSFGWQVLCRGNVVRAGKKIPVDICVLTAEDKRLIDQIGYQWRRNTLVGKYIITSFLRSTPAPASAHGNHSNQLLFNHFMVKPAIGTKEGLSTPLAMGSLIRHKGRYELQYLQTADTILQDTKPDRVKGCGSMLLYGIAKFLNSVNADGLKINSINGPFYRKIFPANANQRGEIFNIEMKTLQDFIEATQEKYGLKSEPKTLPQGTVEEIAKHTFKEEQNIIIL